MLTAGANNVAICWGPVLGAKAITYRSAVLLACICQLAGVLAFGSRTYTVYGGFLSSVFDFNAQPELTLYAIMWTVITPVVWQFLAIRWHILVPVYLGTGERQFTLACAETSVHCTKQGTMSAVLSVSAVASTQGAALVFPGASSINFGHSQKTPPWLSGVGAILMSWLWCPLLSALLVTSSFLLIRTLVFRGEDAFHKALWVRFIISRPW